MTARYHRRRSEWIEKLGGKCVDCSSIEMLEFDHAVAAEKSFDIGPALGSWSEKRVADEMAKCVLRCRECHLKKSMKFDFGCVPHGGGKSGKRRCKCDLCLNKRREYNRDCMRKVRSAKKLIGEQAGV